VRSVHNHFADIEALRAEVSKRQWRRFAPMIGPASTIEQFVDQRAELYEAVTPVRRAALVAVHDSPTIAETLSRVDRLLRRHLELTFPETASETLDALELVVSWDAWNRLRVAQRCTVARARRVVIDLIRTLTNPNLKEAGYET